MQSYQASCVAIGGKALLIEGPPGCGKSSLALALIDRGAVLIGDDSLLLDPREDHLMALPHPQTCGLLEVRNLGLLTFPISESAPVALVIRLVEDAPRYVEGAELIELAGVAIPMLRLWPDSPVLHLKVELALQNYGLA